MNSGNDYARQLGIDEFETRDFPWKKSGAFELKNRPMRRARIKKKTFDDLAKDAPGQTR